MNLWAIVLLGLYGLTSYADESEKLAKEIQQKFENLEVAYSSLIYSSLKEPFDPEDPTNNGFVDEVKKGLIQKIDKSFDCNEKCKKNYKELSEKMNLKYGTGDEKFRFVYFPLTLDENQKYLYTQKLYDSPDLKNVSAQLISTSPLTIKVGDQFYTNESWYEDFKLFYEDVGGYFGTHSFPFVSTEKARAVWLPQLRKFFYFESDSVIASNVYTAKKREEKKCYYRNDITLPTTLDTIILYDDKGNKKTKKDIEGLALANIYKKDKQYILHFLDARKPKISNSIDGVLIYPGYLLTWYGYDNFITYTIPEDQILDENGKLVVVDVVEREVDENRTFVVCPSLIEEPYLSRLKSGEIKFSDLPNSYKTSIETKNIFYYCRGKFPDCN